MIEERDDSNATLVLESKLPVLHYFLTRGSIEKRECASMQILELMRVDMGDPAKYIIINQLYEPIFHLIITSCWDFAREKLVFSAIKLGILMIESNAILRQTLKKLEFLRIFLEGLEVLCDKRVLYGFATLFSEGNTLTVMQLSYKHLLYHHARDKSADSITDLSAQKFIKNSISHFGSISTLLVERQLLNGTSEAEILDMIIDIPIHFKIKDASKIIALLNNVINSLGKYKKQPEKKLEIVKFSIVSVIELLYYWPWLKFAHAHGLCTSHETSKALSYSKNPLLFFCSDCAQTLCAPCASRHPFVSLQFCGYRSDASCCSALSSFESSPLEIRNCDLTPSISMRTSISFLSRIELTKVHSLIAAEEYLTEAPGKIYFEYVMQQDSTPVLLRGGEPLISAEEILEQDKTLAYFEVEVKSGGVKDSIGIGFTGFEFRGDTGMITIDGIDCGKGPMFGSYDCIGVGITAKEVYLTYNGLLFTPFYSHPQDSDYILKISLDGAETAVNVILNPITSASWRFKPPYSSKIESNRFIPEQPTFIDLGFIKDMKARLKDCEQYKRVPEFADSVADIMNKAASVLSFDFIRRNRRSDTELRRRPRRNSPPCELF